MQPSNQTVTETTTTTFNVTASGGSLNYQWKTRLEQRGNEQQHLHNTCHHLSRQWQKIRCHRLQLLRKHHIG
ncbi:MAG: hypothetical protein NZM38_07610 [Cytophagales bacterium]|nr:hypothetical protein [Cytophagales bacterium]MDW8384622.1 hypothetical protein [Flammeovirgaceae bacterium]